MGLFGFGKKKDKPAAAPEPEPVLDREAVLAKIEEVKAKVASAEGVAKSNALNELGKLHADIDQIDEAIAAYEESLEVNHTMGKASTQLVKLYNKKRAQAAEAKDDEQIKYYMDKVNEMLALSKDQLRGRA